MFGRFFLTLNAAAFVAFCRLIFSKETGTRLSDITEILSSKVSHGF